MPKELEQALLRSYEKQRAKGKLKKVDKGAYVYGTMRKTGWKPEREKA